MIDFNYDTRVRRVQLFEGDEGAEDFAAARKRGEKYALTLSPVEAWLVVHGLRDCVNKDAFTHFTGELFIHASRYQSPPLFQAVYRFAASVDAELAEKIPYVSELNRAWSGGIVGRVELDGQYEPDSKNFTSYWHERGMVGWRFAKAQAFDARVPCRGNVGFWRLDGDLCARVDAILTNPRGRDSFGGGVGENEKTEFKTAARIALGHHSVSASTNGQQPAYARRNANPASSLANLSCAPNGDANPEKSVVRKTRTTQTPPKSKRVGKTAMRAEYAKLAKKVKR